ncbi:MAG: insulinase family protein [Bacteroidales bacterium]|nr:insulinase family protein [Bacteroidales bacterium]
MRLKIIIIAALVIVFCGTTTFAQKFPTNEPLPVDSKYKIGKLENGMTYYIREAKNPAGRAEFFIIHNVGSLQEEDSQRGLAHFLEHMAFNGTKNFPKKKLLEYFGSVGVKFGANINAYTSMERTVYNISAVPSLQRSTILDSALLALHDWSHYISCEPAEVEAERGVVREEWRRGDDARSRMMKGIMRVEQTGSRFATRDVIGDPNIINTFTRQTLVDYYNKWYRPDLQAIVVIGDINAADIEKRIKARFSSIPGNANGAKREFYTVPENIEPIIGFNTDPESKAVSVRMTIKLPILSASEMQTNKAVYEDVVRGAFIEMFRTRLQVASESQDSMFRVAVPVFGAISYASKSFTTTMMPTSNKTVFKALKGLMIEVERAQKYGFYKEEFDDAIVRVKKSIDQNYLRAKNPKNEALVSAAVDNFTRNYPLITPEDMYKVSKECVNSITLEDINANIPNILTEKNRVIIFAVPESDKVYLPTKEQVLDMMKEVKNSDIDKFIPASEKKLTINSNLKPAKILSERAVTSKDLGIVYEKQLDSATEWVFANGTKVIWKEEGSNKKEFRMRAFKTGGYSVPADVKQLKVLESFLTYFSVNGLNKVDLQKLLGKSSASVKLDMGYRHAGISGSYMAKDSLVFWNLLYSYFNDVSVDDRSLNNFKNALLKSLESETSEANKYMDSVNTLKYSSFPLKKCYTKDFVKSITADYILSMYKEVFTNANGFTFVISGPMTAAEAKTTVAKYIGTLKGEKPAVAVKYVYKEPVMRTGEVSLRYKAENMLSSKASVDRIYYAQVPYSPETNMYSKFITYILRERYMKSIREERGGTYHVGVTNDMLKFPQPSLQIAIDFDTDPKLVDELLQVVQDEINNFIKNGPTEKEMKEIKLYLSKVYQDRKEDTNWVGIISGALKSEENLSQSEVAMLEKTTAADVKKFANKVFKTNNRMTFVFEPKK